MYLKGGTAMYIQSLCSSLLHLAIKYPISIVILGVTGITLWVGDVNVKDEVQMIHNRISAAYLIPKAEGSDETYQEIRPHNIGLLVGGDPMTRLHEMLLSYD
jgi:hypothetical protein